MKKPILLSILFLSLVFQVTSQNYQTVNSNRIVSFENQSNDVRFVRIDSIQLLTDSVLIPFRGFQEIEYMMCYIIDGAHWIGKEIIIQDNGWNLFTTAEDETVHINTTAAQDDSWTAFERPGELIITASVISHDTLSFLGIPDSVKTIGFQAYDHLMQAINHPVNAMTIALSKSYGLVRTLNFSLFPDLVPFIGNDLEGLHEFEIVGMSDPQVGIQNLTWMEVHDFQPGDEIHVYYYAYIWPTFTMEIQQMIHRYLAREDFDNSVSYTVERIKSRYFQNNQGSTFEFTHDTITETYSPNDQFDKLPGETVLDYDYIAYYYKMNTNWHQAKILPSEYSWLHQGNEECWYYIIIDGCISDHNYYKGLGGPYHYCMLWGEIERTLVYYKKGDEEWGTPLIIIGVDDVQLSSDVKIYPNPARDFLNVELKESALPAKIEIYNAIGSLQKDFKLTEAVQQLSIEGLMPGLYLYRIVSEKEVLGAGKLLVE